MTDVLFNQGNAKNARIKEPFALHTSRSAIGATMYPFLPQLHSLRDLHDSRNVYVKVLFVSESLVFAYIYSFCATLYVEEPHLSRVLSSSLA